MPKYDTRCSACDHVYEHTRKSNEPVPACPECGGKSTVIWLAVNVLDKAKDPYDLLNGPIPSSRAIKSFANDRRKGGKDTV